jgi:hypothetical protein
MDDSISRERESQVAAATPASVGTIASMAAKYTLESDRLVGPMDN